MPTTRNIYNSQVVYVTPSPATGGLYYSGTTRSQTFPAAGMTTGLLYELLRIQNANINVNAGSLQNINQFGELAAIDLVALDSPSVSLDISYILSNFINEKSLGFTMSQGSLVGCLSGILSKQEDDKNYLVWVRPQGYDVHGNSQAISAGTEVVKGIGNGFVNNYQIQAQVGQFPTVTVGIEGSNYKIDLSSANQITATSPALTATGTPHIGTYLIPNPTGGAANYTLAAPTTNISGYTTNSNLSSISVLRPGDIQFTLGYTDMGPSVVDQAIQSVNLQIPLQRETIQKLGQRVTVTKEPQFPIQATMSVDLVVGDMVTGNLYDLVTNCTGKRYDATLTFLSPCGQSGVASYIVKGARLQSFTDNLQIGQNEASTFNFVIPIGSASTQTPNIFFSGVNYNKLV